MDDQRAKAFEFAQESTKQLLTLATGIFALTIVFLNDVATGENAKDALGLLHWAWGFYVASVLFGAVTLMMLAGNLERPHQGTEPSIYARNTARVAAIQVLTFATALVLTFFFGVQAI